jgi:CHAT domain-containing protein
VVLAVAVAAVWLAVGTGAVKQARLRGAVTRLADATPTARLPRARFSALGAVRNSTLATTTQPSTADVAPAAAVLEQASGLTSPQAARAAAVAAVIGGDITAAILRLESAVARDANDTLLWSDLAAARYELGTTSSMLDALVAVDRALRLDAKNGDALYNRGLILEAFGVYRVAAASWQACLLTTDDERLLTAARDALRRVERETENARWRAADPTLVTSSAQRIRQLVTQLPQPARRYSEVKYLGAWGKAVLEGDVAAAEQHLRVARIIGAALKVRDETLLSDAVAAVDAADSSRRRLLAEAHASYDAGRLAYSKDECGQAEPLLRRASALFAEGGSPMALSADYFAANTLIDRSQINEGHAELNAVLARVRPTSYRALTAEVLWELALAEGLRGALFDATTLTLEALSIFNTLGETENAGAAEGQLAELFDRLGRGEEAWARRMSAMRLLSIAGDARRLSVTLTAGERNAIRDERWSLARSLVGLDVELAGNAVQPRVNSLALRSIVEHRLGDFVLSERTLREGRAETARIAAPETRAHMAAVLDAAEGTVLRDRDPARAIEVLTRALDFYQRNQRTWLVPDVHLQRGRAYAAAGDQAGAWREYAAGLDAVESQRLASVAPAGRAQVLDAAEDLVDEALALLVATKDTDLAFSYAERTRARSLLDLIDDGNAAAVDRRTIQALLPPDVLFVEFAVLRDQLVTFAIRNNDYRVFTAQLRPIDLGRRVDRLSTLIAARAPLDIVRRDAKELYDLLFGQLGSLTTGARSIVLVPDYVLQRVPFAGLWTAERWLFEEASLVVAPSASVLVAGSKKPAARYRNLLVVANPQLSSMVSLPFAEREADAIAALYGSPKALSGKQATKANFLAAVPHADVIHFAGHGLGDAELSPALFFAGESGRMYAHEISHLTLPRRPLVFVAACSTLRGRSTGLDGTRSIASAFLGARASTVVGTLWDIDDEPSAFIATEFHRALGHESPAEALRTAQRASLARGGHPADWAPFVVFSTTMR